MCEPWFANFTPISYEMHRYKPTGHVYRHAGYLVLVSYIVVANISGSRHGTHIAVGTLCRDLHVDDFGDPASLTQTPQGHPTKPTLYKLYVLRPHPSAMMYFLKGGYDLRVGNCTTNISHLRSQENSER